MAANKKRGRQLAPTRGVDGSARAAEDYQKTMSILARYGDVGRASPHEPFLQAWQKNLEGCGAGSPLLMAFSGVYACVTIIAQDIAKLPLQLLRTDENETPTIAKNHPIHRLYTRGPNDYQTTLEFMMFHVAARCTHGNAYIYKEFDERGVVRAMHNIHPKNVTVMVAPDKRVWYQVKHHATEEWMSRDTPEFARDGAVMIPANYIIHDRINTIWHPLVGVSPIYAAASSAATGGRILMQSESFFGNMSRPGGVLTAPGTINEVTATRLKREWEDRYSGGNFGKTAVLGDGLKFDSVMLDPIDAQLIEQLRWSIEDIARVFRVPMYLLADPSKLSVRNSEQLARSYYQGCLQYHVEGIERRFDKDLALASDLYTNFDLDALFRMETDARFDSYQKGINSGVLSINEARKKEGLPPVKGGETPRIQVQYQPIDAPQAVLTPNNPATPEDEGADNPDIDDPVDDDDDDDTNENSLLPLDNESNPELVFAVGAFHHIMKSTKTNYALVASEANDE